MVSEAQFEHSVITTREVALAIGEKIPAGTRIVMEAFEVPKESYEVGIDFARPRWIVHRAGSAVLG
jgi:hypothetical protein